MFTRLLFIDLFDVDGDVIFEIKWFPSKRHITLFLSFSINVKIKLFMTLKIFSEIIIMYYVYASNLFFFIVAGFWRKLHRGESSLVLQTQKS